MAEDKAEVAPSVGEYLTKQEAGNISMGETGVPGLEQNAGIIREEFLTELRGSSGIDVYTEMKDNDPVIGAYLFALEMLIKQADWHIKPPEGADEEEQRVVFLETVFEDMARPWDDYISEILTMLPYGWALLEKVYKQRDEENSHFPDGKIGVDKLSIRSQTTLQRWRFDDTGQLEGFVQISPRTGERFEIPRDKFLLFRPQAHKNNPEGRSILRNAYRPWLFKKRIEEIEGIGIERDLAGLPVGYIPPQYLSQDATDAQTRTKEAFQDMLQNMRNDQQAYALIPSVFEGNNRLFDVELMNSGGKRNFDTTKIIDRYDRRIAMTVLADFLLVGHENVGSFALASSKTKFFTMAVAGFLDSIKEPINRELIPELLLANGFQLENPPKLDYGDVEDLDLAQLGAYIRNLVDAGVLQAGDSLEDFARERINAPTREEESNVREDAGAGDSGGQQNDGREGPDAQANNGGSEGNTDAE